LEATLPESLTFLTEYFHSGIEHSVINGARSSLSGILSRLHLCSNQITKGLIKGVFNRRPSFPKLSSIWDVKRFFELFRWPAWDVKNLQLKTQAQKLAIIFVLSAC